MIVHPSGLGRLYRSLSSRLLWMAADVGGEQSVLDAAKGRAAHAASHSVRAPANKVLAHGGDPLFSNVRDVARRLKVRTFIRGQYCHRSRTSAMDGKRASVEASSRDGAGEGNQTDAPLSRRQP